MASPFDPGELDDQQGTATLPKITGPMNKVLGRVSKTEIKMLQMLILIRISQASLRYLHFRKILTILFQMRYVSCSLNLPAWTGLPW